MSNIDKLMEKLKSAALKLNCEQWQTRNGFSGVEVIVKGSVAKGHGCVSYQPVASELVDTKTAKAIALFCPANILALLDELEAKDKLNAELMEKQRLIDICQGQGMEHRIAAEKRAESAEKRIAELQAVKCKLSDSKLLTLAKDIVENLVDTGGSDPEYTQQYVDWTFKRIRAAAGKGE